MCSDEHAGQDAGVHPNIRAKAHRDRLDHEPGCDNWLGTRYARMSRPKNLGTRSPSDVVFQHQIPSVEVSLWSDPNMTSDLAGSIESSLDHALRPYKSVSYTH